MKKIIALLLVAIMALSVAVASFAAPGAFVSSPSGKDAPTLVDYDYKSEKCTAEVVICSYSDRAQLSLAARANLEAAYASVVGAASVSSLNADLADLIAELEISDGVLAVSDLFEVYYKNCDPHTDHGPVTLTIAPRVIENMVAILHYVDGEWELVGDCSFDENGTDVSFEVDSLSPFAIIVHDGSVDYDPTTPSADGGNGALIAASVCIGLIVIIAIVVAVLISKKKINFKKN